MSIRHTDQIFTFEQFYFTDKSMKNLREGSFKYLGEDYLCLQLIGDKGKILYKDGSEFPYMGTLSVKEDAYVQLGKKYAPVHIKEQLGNERISIIYAVIPKFEV